MSDRRDTIYAHPAGELGAFTFDQRVADVFPDMINRSVPGYNTIIGMTGLLGGRYASAGTQCYDLGCSLGASTLSMRRHIVAEGCRIIGVDNSPAMLKRCARLVDEDTHNTPVQLICQNIEETAIENASVVVLNFTLQFVPLAQRDALMRGIFAGLKPGGIVILSEKVLFADPALDALNTELHHQFKAANGYSDLEIAQKRSALENVLIPETLAQHKARMRAAGFRSCDVWFQCFNFASMVALK
ncbi:MAG: carboxy-S-adenosyl-L-methionine synthase CmoA [Gammaproteobacteria bacterium]|nr:MAG: carboxy-S-adenosyl-L-methionine synthase CmoA [Gammaproteobacteria bacterium]